MLEFVKISRRQSEIRGALASLVGKDKPTDDEVRSMTDLDKEYATNETRYRASLVAEDEERTKAKGELETRGTKEWGELISRFEMRQVVLALDEGAALNGQTAEVVTELRSKRRISRNPGALAGTRAARRRNHRQRHAQPDRYAADHRSTVPCLGRGPNGRPDDRDRCRLDRMAGRDVERGGGVGHDRNRGRCGCCGVRYDRQVA